jgi:predicted aspartyl protease
LSIFRIRIVAVNPTDEGQATAPLEALVDTSTELTWLPAEALRAIGVTPRRKRSVATTIDDLVEREVGYAILRAEGREGQETADEVVFAEPGERARLGVRTLASFGIKMDDTEFRHRFIGLTTMAAFNKETGSKTVVKFSLKLQEPPAVVPPRAKSALVKARQSD